MGIVPIDEWKMPLKHWGMLLFPLVGRVLSVLAASDPLLYFGEKDGRKVI